MRFISIVIRDATYEALAGLRTKSFESQMGVSLDLSLSDVIDTLLEIASETQPDAEVLEAIGITAERN